MVLRVFDIYNKSYKSALFIAHDDIEAVEIAKASGHLRKGLPRRLYERTPDEVAALYPKPEKLKAFLAEGKSGALRFERSNQSWIFDPS